MNQGMYLCFNDYTIVFDKVKQEEIIRMLENLNSYGEYLNVYWQHKAALKS